MAAILLLSQFGPDDGELRYKMKAWVTIIALLTTPIVGFSQTAPNDKNALREYPGNIPTAEERKAPRYQKEDKFPADEIKFIGEENGKTIVYNEVMDQYLSPDTIREVKSRALKWLIVRNAYQDTEYRHYEDVDVVEYPVIVDMRYVQQAFTGIQMNGTLQAVYVVRQVNGKPEKVTFVTYNHSGNLEAAYTYPAGAEQLMRAVLDDTLKKIYGLTPVKRMH